MDIYLKIAIILLIALISGELCIRIGIPSVVGQLIAGVLVGPSLLSIINIDQELSLFSNIGVIALMFMAGLESNLSKIKKYLIPASSVALVGALVPFFSFIAFSRFVLNEGLEVSILFGILFAAMSTSITIDTLKEYNSLNSKNGVTIMTSAIFDDIIAVSTLSIFLTLYGVSGTKQTSSLLVMISEQIFFFIFIFIVSKYFIPYFTLIFDKLKLPFSNLIGSWIIVWLAVGSASIFGVSDIIASFICGVAISETKIKDEVLSLTSIPAFSIFVPVFLVSVGLELHSLYIPNIYILIAAVALSVVSKVFGSGLGAYVTKKYTINDSAIIGSGTVPRGEFSVVIAQIGSDNKIITDNMHSFVLIIIILSTIIGPLMLKHFLEKESK
ncbi:cation:proton antiporter [Lactococcus lactis]|uniref:cation:proton antiporter n=1 Tax=Lactococcus lactis TaxID=1358 RepID=UPI002418175A|nr:cation:proton antiporter [Lactococcus lactis]MDG4967176.1 cation:proton antiporter [Lactococcus lactis]